MISTRAALVLFSVFAVLFVVVLRTTEPSLSIPTSLRSIESDESVVISNEPVFSCEMFDQNRCAPGFVIIGVPKAGTTSLYSYLIQHPQVVGASKKELHFFRPIANPNLYNKIVRGIKDPEEQGLKLFESLSSQYVDLFPKIDGGQITGEASPGYFYSPQVASFLAQFKNLKVILSIRDPADRAFSEYLNKVETGRSTTMKKKFLNLVDSTPVPTFDEIAATGLKRFQICKSRALVRKGDPCYVPPNLWQGHYDDFILPWIHAFGPERLFVLSAEKLFKDSQSTMQSVIKFLNLNPFKFDTSAAYNTATNRGADVKLEGNKQDGEIANAQRPKMSIASRSALAIYYKGVLDSFYALLDEYHILYL